MAKKPSMFPLILGLVLLAGLVLLTLKEGFTEDKTPAEQRAKKQKAEAKKRKEALDVIDAAAETAAQDKANEK